MLGKHQQQLVVNADGLVDGDAELVADLEVFGREPAADAFDLEVSVKPLGELLILGRVADETGVELQWFADKGASIFD